jgi:hypothetical protein
VKAFARSSIAQITLLILSVAKRLLVKFLKVLIIAIV